MGVNVGQGKHGDHDFQWGRSEVVIIYPEILIGSNKNKVSQKDLLSIGIGECESNWLLLRREIKKSNEATQIYEGKTHLTSWEF
jgi:hypothetical protein